MKINLKEFANDFIKGAVVIGTIVLTAYAEGLGSRTQITAKSLPFASSPDDMAISELLKAAKDYWSDSDKMTTAQKIYEIATKPEQSCYTKTVAISALSQIRDTLWSGSSKRAITDLIVGITQ